jgi:enoyl-CoA hydratase/carnithine racemase
MSAVQFQVDAGVARIRLNRPDRLNAVNYALIDGLHTSLRQAVADDGVGAILLEAAGRAFCAGDDLKEFAANFERPTTPADFVDRLQDISRLMMLEDKPVVCAAQGYIVGAGAAWPLNSDFCLMADDAVMFCPEAQFGLFVSGGASILLAEALGQQRANQMIWLGERVGARQLAEAGLTLQLVPRANLEAASLTLARRVAALPQQSRHRLKRARRLDLEARLEAALAFEAKCCIEAARDVATAARVADRLQELGAD